MKKKTHFKKIHQIFRNRLAGYSHVLERIKYFPWFSVLLTLMLGWKGYQLSAKHNASSWTTLKQSIHYIKQRLPQTASKSSEPNEHARQSFDSVDSPQTQILPSQETPSADLASSEEQDAKTPINKKETEVPEPLDRQTLIIEKRLQAIRAELEQSQSENSSLRKELNEALPQLEHLRQLLHEKTQQLSELERTKNASQTSTEVTSEASESEPKNYSVYAVIQGRAWLNTPEGKILTIRVGSLLPPFGMVQSIDTENGLVYLDQGYVIGPSENDS